MSEITKTGAPFEYNGYTYVALAPVVERMGGRVEWDNASKQATISLDGKTASVQMANEAATVDGRSVRLIAPPLVTEDTMIVPASFFGDALGRPI